MCYTGETNFQGQPPGEGVWTGPNGRMYDGEFKDGKKHGSGVFIYGNGKEKYEGFWKNNMRHTRGVWTGPTGDKYIGEWKEGLMHGKGVYTWSDNRLL